MAKTVVSIEPVSDGEADVAIVNSIADFYKKERQQSNAPTFALTR